MVNSYRAIRQFERFLLMGRYKENFYETKKEKPQTICTTIYNFDREIIKNRFPVEDKKTFRREVKIGLKDREIYRYNKKGELITSITRPNYPNERYRSQPKIS